MKNNIIRLVCISDTHGLHDGIEKKFGELPEGDILIHAGDVSNIGAIWDIERFLDWFGTQQHKHKCFIGGNHDFGLERQRHDCKTIIDEKIEEGCNLTYLEDCSKEIESLKFWGSPVTSPFFDWAFNKEDDYRAQLWNTIPNDVDILITHGPPHNILDLSKFGNEHCGCPYLEAAIKNRIKPLVSIFGHLHEEYGVKIENDIMFINASTLNDKYQVVNKPIVVDINIETREVTLVDGG